MEQEVKKERRKNSEPYICPCCHEVFRVPNRKKYQFKIHLGKKNYVFLCGYNCMIKQEKFERQKKVLDL